MDVLTLTHTNTYTHTHTNWDMGQGLDLACPTSHRIHAYIDADIHAYIMLHLLQGLDLACHGEPLLFMNRLDANTAQSGADATVSSAPGTSHTSLDARRTSTEAPMRRTSQEGALIPGPTAGARCTHTLYPATAAACRHLLLPAIPPALDTPASACRRT